MLGPFYLPRSDRSGNQRRAAQPHHLSDRYHYHLSRKDYGQARYAIGADVMADENRVDHVVQGHDEDPGERGEG